MESQNTLKPIPKSLRLQQVEQLVEASPFRELLRLPPEEVLDFFRSKVGQALIRGVSVLKDREVSGLMSSKADAATIVGEMYEVRGIASVCDILLGLQKQVEDYSKALRNESNL